MIVKSAAAILLPLAIAACAQLPSDPAAIAAANEPLICHNKEQCDLYWQRAQVFVANSSGYRLQTVTDTIISTYGPFGAKVELAYQVSKVPRGDGSALLMVRPACDNIFGCRPTVYEGATAFKNYVRGVP